MNLKDLQEQNSCLSLVPQSEVEGLKTTIYKFEGLIFFFNWETKTKSVSNLRA